MNTKRTKCHHVRIKVMKVPTFGENAPVQLKGAMRECRINQYIFDKKRRDEVFLTHEPSQIHGSMIPMKTD